MKRKFNGLGYTALIVIFAVALIVSAFNVSFSYYVAKVEGTPTKTNVKAATFDFETSLTNLSGLKATNLDLINENEIEAKSTKLNFTVQSKAITKSVGKFNIYLKDIAISKNLITDGTTDFKWQVLMDNEIIATGNFSDLKTKGTASETPDTDTTSYYSRYYLKEGINFKGLNQSTISVRVYLLNTTGNQNYLMNGTFECKVGVEAYNE